MQRRSHKVHDDYLLIILGLVLLGTVFSFNQSEEFEQRISLSKANNSEITDQILALSKENTAANARLVKLQATIDKTKQTLAKEASEKTSLAKDLKELTNAKTSVEKTLSSRLSEKTTELGALSQKNEEQNQTIRALVEQVEVSKRQIASLIDTRQSMDLQVARLQKQLTETQAKVSLGPEINQAFLNATDRALADRTYFRRLETKAVLQSDPLFEKGVLTPEGQSALNEIARQIRSVDKKGVEMGVAINVHTTETPVVDALTPPPSAQSVSDAQVISIARYLKSLGFTKNQIFLRSQGATKALDSRQDEFAQRRNRRLEISLFQVE